jgi:hypothetical protein
MMVKQKTSEAQQKDLRTISYKQKGRMNPAFASEPYRFYGIITSVLYRIFAIFPTPFIRDDTNTVLLRLPSVKKTVGIYTIYHIKKRGEFPWKESL